MQMDTFQTLADNDGDDLSDADSQRNIVKETKYTVTSTAITAGEDRAKNQVHEWERRQSSAV
jgi:hypothetical protein